MEWRECEAVSEGVLMNFFLFFLFPLIPLEERGEVSERHVSPRVWKKKIYFLISLVSCQRIQCKKYFFLHTLIIHLRK